MLHQILPMEAQNVGSGYMNWRATYLKHWDEKANAQITRTNSLKFLRSTVWDDGQTVIVKGKVMVRLTKASLWARIERSIGKINSEQHMSPNCCDVKSLLIQYTSHGPIKWELLRVEIVLTKRALFAGYRSRWISGQLKTRNSPKNALENARGNAPGDITRVTNKQHTMKIRDYWQSQWRNKV